MPTIRARKKPVEIEVLLWTGDNKTEFDEFIGDQSRVRLEHRTSVNSELTWDVLYVWSSEEHQSVAINVGHYVAKRADGEFYPLSPEALERDFDIITE
jgi:hypothetical protein